MTYIDMICLFYDNHFYQTKERNQEAPAGMLCVNKTQTSADADL